MPSHRGCRDSREEFTMPGRRRQPDGQQDEGSGVGIGARPASSLCRLRLESLPRASVLPSGAEGEAAQPPPRLLSPAPRSPCIRALSSLSPIVAGEIPYAWIGASVEFGHLQEQEGEDGGPRRRCFIARRRIRGPQRPLPRLCPAARTGDSRALRSRLKRASLRRRQSASSIPSISASR